MTVRLRLVSVAVLVAFLAMTGCDQFPAFTIRNETSESLVIVGVDDAGQERHIDDVLPGEARWIRGHLDPSTHCTSASFITIAARNEDGEVIAFRDEPLCDGDEWVIAERQP
jgi:hypothetical protein